MEDVVHDVIPFGCPGQLAAARFVKKELQKIFDLRREALAKKFGTI